VPGKGRIARGENDPVSGGEDIVRGGGGKIMVPVQKGNRFRSQNKFKKKRPSVARGKKGVSGHISRSREFSNEEERASCRGKKRLPI